jgi:hypothetical protein
MSANNPLAAFTNVAASTRNVCPINGQDLNEVGRAAINIDLFSRPVGADKQERIAHHTVTLSPEAAAQIWAIMLAAHPATPQYVAPVEDEVEDDDKVAA